MYDHHCCDPICKTRTHVLEHMLMNTFSGVYQGDPQLLVIPVENSPGYLLTSLGVLAIHTSLTKEQVLFVSGKVSLGPEAKLREKGKLKST